MEADRSGFYCRTAESNEKNFKYDMNKAYKSFDKSGIFKGFPILEAVFEINRTFSKFVSEMEQSESGGGLLYIEYSSLTESSLSEKIYVRCLLQNLFYVIYI